MKNSVNDIGKKLKALRMEKNLTQSELCGTEITRNHLSLIESGKSLPSLSTLCYISERLDVPVGYFFSGDEQTEAKFANLFTIEDAKESYAAENYSKCVQICEIIPSSLRGDEISLLLAMARLRLALAAAERLDISAAMQNLKGAAEASQRSFYLSSDFTSAVSYYELLFSSLAVKEIPRRLADLREASSYVPVDLILYFRMLFNKKHISSAAELTSELHREHAEALTAKGDSDFGTAFTILKKLSENPSLPYYMRYHVYDDLEICADMISEFRTAYEAAKLKMNMMSL